MTFYFEVPTPVSALTTLALQPRRRKPPRHAQRKHPCSARAAPKTYGKVCFKSQIDVVHVAKFPENVEETKDYKYQQRQPSAVCGAEEPPVRTR